MTRRRPALLLLLLAALAAGAATVEPRAPSAPAHTEAAERLAVTVEEAVRMALENNRALRVERVTPLIRRADEQSARAAFDPVLSGTVSTGEEKDDIEGYTNETVETVAGGAALTQSFAPGTDVSVEFDASDSSGAPEASRSASRVGLSVSQPLLRGAGPGANLVSVRQARLDTQLSEYELRGVAEALVAEVETTYWEYVLAQRQIEIYERSLQLAEQQMEETRQRVRVGSLAETEMAAAQAETALRREALINARGRAATLRAHLVRLIHPTGLGGRAREVAPQSQPRAPDEKPGPMSGHIEQALRLRPDLNEARLRLKRQDLELVRTRNGLLPRLDVFVSLGRTGYASSFGDSVSNLDGDGYDVKVGLALEYPLGRRDARARHRKALLTRAQVEEAMANLADLVREDVELALIEVERTSEQMAATSATRALQEENLRAETAKFRSGKTTSLSVAQVQRDLVSSEIAEVQAIVRHIEALVLLYRRDGSLLLRRGIQAPGDTPAPDA